MSRRIAGIAGCLLLGLSSFAHGQSYAQQRTNIRAAIVELDSAQTSAGQPADYAPHVWYNLDSNFAVKPAGWNIYNPAATTQATQAILDRWAGFTTPALNSPLTKASGPYWEVLLSQASDVQLSNYDVLLVPAYGFTNLNSIERDKLRKFVDQGGTLWIDISSNTNFNNAQVNTFPLPVQGLTTFGSPALTDADIFNPLMMTPYALTLVNLEQMRYDRNSFAQAIDLGTLGMSGYWQIESWLETDFGMHFNVVASSSNRPTILSAQLGDGHVVVTTSALAATLNQVPNGSGGYNTNVDFNGVTPAFDRSSQLAGKLAVNIISLGSSYPQVGGGARKGNSIPLDLLPPLLRKSGIPDTNVQANQSPVLYKGLLVVASGNKLKVYDANPKADLDGDGNPDDGLEDFILGEDYDELWESPPMGGQISSATCGEVPGSAHKDQIWVVDDTGVLYAYDAFDVTNGKINANQTVNNPIYTIRPPEACQVDTGQPGPGPYAPTLHDGLLYVATVAQNPTSGLIYVADPNSQQLVQTQGTTNWFVGASGSASLPVPSGSPTIGYIPVQDNSGAYDRVMYFPGRPTGAIGPSGTASITSLWMGVRGESPPPNSITPNPSSPQDSPTEMVVVTRAAHQGLKVYCDSSVPIGAVANRALGVKLTMLHANGDPFTNLEMQTYFEGTVTENSGVLTFPLRQQLPANFAVRLDYSIDWAPPAATLGGDTVQIIRGQLFLPDNYQETDPDNRRRIIGNIAMSPRGTLYCVTSTQKETNAYDGGSFYALREDIGRGGFRLLTRYQLYPRHTIPLNQAAPAIVPETLSDTDPLASMITSSGFVNMLGTFNHLTFWGTPSVRDGVVYVTAIGRKTGGSLIASQIPYGILMAFKAEPPEPEIRVGNIPDGFSLRQYDIDRSQTHAAPSATNDMSQGQFSYDRGQGIIRFDNLMSTNRGPMVNAFSTSQPVVIRRNNAPDQVIYPDANGDKWSPLLWYSVMHGMQPTAGPMTTGGSVFVPISSYAANYLLGTLSPSGMIEAWKADVSPTDPFLGSDSVRPWNHQLYQITLSGGVPSGNPDMLWPQLTGITSFQDYVVRLRQTKCGNSRTCYGVAGGEGSLAAWGDRGVYTFSKADFLVADEKRLARFDAVGNPLWASDTSSSTGTADTGSVGTVKPLIRPVRAYPVGTNDVLVADPGANRVARIDLSGRELRSITNFVVDPANIPDGFKSNEPLTLNSPRDVATFTTYQNNEYWVHYLIADTGNRRVIDVVDRFSLNASGQPAAAIATGVLYWHSPANFSGKDYDYNSISRIYEPVSQQYFYCAGIGNALPTRIDTGLDSPAGGASQEHESVAGNGGVVIFDPQDPSKNVVINKIVTPNVQLNSYWDFQTGTFNSPASGSHYKLLSNVNSVTSRIVLDGSNVPRVALMITDSSGIYEVWLQDPSNDPRTDWIVRWMLPNEAYRDLRHVGTGAPMAQNPVGLHATYARRLDDGDVLVVNGYLGKTLGGADFLGEVIQVDGDINAGSGYNLAKPNLGFDLSALVFQLPPITGARGLVLPVFADRR
ncbi:MAG TPA: hypothetical protein VHE55_16805 [Fimbriimonadaceae bacterium]|nr:hypothetical protein [Fimbriimonadaceae bacterium]